VLASVQQLADVAAEVETECNRNTQADPADRLASASAYGLLQGLCRIDELLGGADQVTPFLR
jgi:hypothetical protein